MGTLRLNRKNVPQEVKTVDEKVLEFVVEKCKNGCLITRETIQLKALEIAASLKIPWQDFKASNGWAVRFMCCKVLALHQRTTLPQMFPTDYIEKLIAYQPPYY
jgi:hypothetical protein